MAKSPQNSIPVNFILLTSFFFFFLLSTTKSFGDRKRKYICRTNKKKKKNANRTRRGMVVKKNLSIDVTSMINRAIWHVICNMDELPEYLSSSDGMLRDTHHNRSNPHHLHRYHKCHH